MAEMKNICGKIPVELHEKVRAEIEEKETSTQIFIRQVIEEHFNRLEGKGEESMEKRTLAVQVTEELFQRVKWVVAKEGIKQKDFIIRIIEKAVNCYADMLAAGESTTLPRAVQSAIDSRLKLFEDRIASLLYKQAVEMDMAMSILLQSLNVSEEVLRQERAKSIAAVKRTNGQLRLEQKLRELESEAWQD